MTKMKKIVALFLSLALLVSAGLVSAQAATAQKEDTAAEATGITVHYKSTGTVPYIYYWNSLPQNKETSYPGVQMNRDSAQGEGWYTYTFNDVTKINLMFTDKDGNQLTSELTRNTGEWWLYNNRIWRNSNPDNAETVEDIDFREETIYFVITTRFYDGDKSNNVHCWDDGKANNPDTDTPWRGDFKGLAQKLDYIKALGFSAIWITPVVENASGYDYHGYHAMNFEKVDPRYESNDFTYQDLIDAAHAKGMKIVQDVVWNHTGNFGETQLCNLFEKDYSADLGNIKESMIPTQQLLDEAGVSTAQEYWSLPDGEQHDARLNLMKNNGISANNSTGLLPDSGDYTIEKLSSDSKYNPNNYWHTSYFRSLNWDDWSCKYAQIAGDCVDLNTENPAVAQYTTDAYGKYINMGVDAFRVDTARHISRLTLNMMYNPQIMAAAEDSGNNGFYMFGEVCCRDNNYFYRNHAGESVPFYTWAESDPSYAQKWSWGTDPESINNNMNLTFDHYIANDGKVYEKAPTSDNAFLNGISYHEPDYSQASGMNTIDFSMHWNFDTAGAAYGTALQEDKYFNDSTWNVVYVDSHDYSPNQGQQNRYAAGTQAWAENMDLMFTFRGIPCLYYGSEVEFQKGVVIDVGPGKPLASTGRAYYGDYLEGTVSASDFSECTATGAVADTLNSPLSKHLSKLNAIRRAVPALQKGQYTTGSNYVSGNMAYVRRYTNADENVDSLALVTISGGATFKNIPNGTYIDAVTGDRKEVTNGTLTTDSIGTANMRVYVCCASGFTGISGQIGGTSTYIK